MRENKLKTLWASGAAAVNGWLHIPSAWSAEIMANAGWDSVTVDLQHGMMGFETAVTMLQAISTTATVPLVRVPWNEPGIIGRVLDAGAYGVICPMVDTPEQCAQFVGAARYHPAGFRSAGPTRARVYGGADYMSAANMTVLTFAMIETTTALANLDAIAATPGLDGLYVGPGDLRLSLLGKDGMDNQEPEFLDVLDRVIAACQAHHIIPGIHTGSSAYARQMVERGMRFVTVQSDGVLLGSAARAAAAAVRDAGAGSAPTTPAAY